MGKKMEISTMGLYIGFRVTVCGVGHQGMRPIFRLRVSGFIVYDVHWSSVLPGIPGLWLGGLEGLRVEGWVALGLLRLHLDGSILRMIQA